MAKQEAVTWVEEEGWVEGGWSWGLSRAAKIGVGHWKK